MNDLPKYLICPFFIFSNLIFSFNHAKAQSADDLFRKGNFAEAERKYREILEIKPDTFNALAKLGSIALFSNDLNEAEKWLTKAHTYKPQDKQISALLGEVYYRRDDFKNAAPYFRGAGSEAMAKKLEAFGSSRPYSISGNTGMAILKFVITDPLPVVRIRINGNEEANFLIDTGGGEVIIDTEYAEQIGASRYGEAEGTFAGGKKGSYQLGRVDTVTLGEFEVRNVPVSIMPTRRMAGVAGGRRIDGIIGTVLFYHFIATLDYPAGELILRRNTKENLEAVESEAKRNDLVMVPFWMAGDHFMVAWGTANGGNPLLFFIDTGAAGIGFLCPKSTIKEAGIDLSKAKTIEGIGGAGKVKAKQFMVDELTLGDAKEKSIISLSEAFPPSLEYGFGFRIGGLISHAFFRNYAVTFDFIGMRLLLEKKQ